MTNAQSKFDPYSRTILNSAVSEFDAEKDPAKRFLKYALTITNSEQATIEAQIRKAEALLDVPGSGHLDTVPLDPDVFAYFKNTGGDWHRRINDVLRASIKKN